VVKLEELLDQLRAQKHKVDAEEQRRVAAYHTAMENKKEYALVKTDRLEEQKSSKAEKTETMAKDKQNLKLEVDLLHDDQRYLSSIAADCANKEKTYKQRSELRVQELGTLANAMAILQGTVRDKTGKATVRFVQVGSPVIQASAVAGDDDAMMALEAEAEAAEGNSPAVFLQTREHLSHTASAANATPDSRRTVASLLKAKGTQLKSAVLMNLALRVGLDPIAKVKALVKELIERALQEASNEATQKGWCDKAMGEAKQKRNHASTQVAQLNAKMAKLVAADHELAEEIQKLNTEIQALKDRSKDATKLRREEHAESIAAIADAGEGRDATNEAIEILSQFYKTAAKARVDLSLLKTSAAHRAAPDVGFESGEAYQGAGEKSGGIVAVLEVISSDFTRTIKHTQAADDAADKELNKFLTEADVSIAEKRAAIEAKSKHKDEGEEKLEQLQDSLQAQSSIVASSVEELLKLKDACVDTGDTYEEKAAKREEEITSLNEALEKLSE